ncbi:hypothetical protein BGX27_001670 [Mortierella sp. AM989]|nr:hypothetical protein BGX27_001670 [Mortierella sp. AM989]
MFCSLEPPLTPFSEAFDDTNQEIGATCIKGHRSTTCNHGERPLHEIKKKGRPSTQCMHCKELRKAKQVSVRCICGKEEDGYSCGCLDGAVCTCCRDRAGHVVAKPGKSSSKHAVFKSYQSKPLGAASLDLEKVGVLFDPQDTSSLNFPQHAPGMPSIHSPNGSVSSNSSLGLNNTFNGMGITAGRTSSQFIQSLNAGSSGGDHLSSTTSPLGSQQSQLQPSLCFDYASSSDYDSDHYNPPTSYSYFPQTMTSYPVSNASDDLGERDLNTLQDTPRRRPTPMNTLSSEDVGSLYTVLSNFNTSISQGPTQSTQTTAIPSSTTKKSCCKPTNGISSPVSSNFSQSPSASRSDDNHEETESDGCGCAISPNMCCCGELCACPGCLSYPNNQAILTAGYLQESVSGDGASDDNANFSNVNSLSISSQSPTSSSLGQKGSCCGSGKTNSANANTISELTGNNGVQALNLSQALSLIEANSQNASAIIDSDVRQALRQSLSMIGHNGMEPVKMQHPTLLGDNGVLTCGCGCGRPTVDCADCFRDMCEFVGESQARMIKEELDFDMAMNHEGGYLADLGLNMNMSMAMNMNLGVDLDLNMDVNMESGTSDVPGIEILPSQDPMDESVIYGQEQQREQEQQKEQQQLQSNQSQYQEQFSNQHQIQSQYQQETKHTQQEQQQPDCQPELLEQEQRLRLQLMEQMQLSQLQPSALNQFQLDFLDDEDWSFVDEIRTDNLGFKK